MYGIRDLAAFLWSPIVVVMATRFGAKWILILGGITLAFSAGILFAFLDDIEDRNSFLIYYFTLRLANVFAITNIK